METKIKIIGTSHISPESVRKIEKTITEEKPDCVAVELDSGRLRGLLRKETISIRLIPKIGIRNYLLAKILSIIQNYFGRKTGIMPGEEMLTAVKTAGKANADLALIDRDIMITMNRLRAIPFAEKIKIFLNLFKKTDVGEFDLEKVPGEKVVEKILESVKKTAPNLYKVLVEERDLYMAVALLELGKRYKRIIAVVGVGHRKGIATNLKKLSSKKNL